MILQKGSKNLQVSENSFNGQFEKYYIDKNGLKIARNLYREYYIKQKLQQKVISKRGKVIHPKCNTKWPICISQLQHLKRQREEIDVWVYRTQNSPKIIPDYLTNKSLNFQPKIQITGTIIATNLSNDDRFESKQHKNFHKKQSICTSYGKYKNDQQKINLINNQYYHNDVSEGKNIPKKSTDLIIGRMDHICQQQPIEMEKMKKVKKGDVKFLSMIFQANQGPNLIEQKRCQTYKKIAKASQIFSEGHQVQMREQCQEKTNCVQDLIEKTNISEQEERAFYARSRTINFYNQFMEKNKQISSIISGVECLRKEQIKKQSTDDRNIDTQINEVQENMV